MAESLASLYIEFDTRPLQQADTILQRMVKTLEDAGAKVKGYAAGHIAQAAAASKSAAATQNLNRNFTDANGRLRDAQGRFLGVGHAANQAALGINQAALSSNKLKGVVVDVNPLLLRLQTMMGGLGLALGAREILETADSMQSLNNQLKLVTGSESAALSVRKELLEISNRTYASLEATGSLYVKSSRALEAYGYSQQKVLQFVEAANNAMRVGGVGAREQAAALFQLSQALGSGRLQGDEFRSISEAAPIMLDILARYLGKTRAEIRALASEGKLTTRVIVDAMVGAEATLSKQTENMSLTLGQSLSVLRNNWAAFVDDLMNGSGTSSVLASGVMLLAENIDTLATVIGALMGMAFLKWLAGAGAALLVLVAKGAMAVHALRGIGVSALFAVGGLGKMTAAATASAAQVTSLSRAMIVLRAASANIGAGFTSIVKSGLGVFMMQAASTVLAAYSAFTALSSASEFLQGRDASNSISDGFDDLLDKFGLIDKRVESFGTKLYDILNAKPSNAMQEFMQFFVSPANYFRLKVTGDYDETASMERGVYRGSLANTAVLDADVSRGAIDIGKGLEELQKGMDETVLKYREQAATVGMTKEQIALMGLEAQRDAAMKQHIIAVNEDVRLTEEEKRRQLAMTLDDYNRKIESTKAAMDKIARSAEASKLADNIAKTADEYEKQIARFGKAGLELAEVELAANRTKLNLSDLSEAAARAAEADYARATSAIETLKQMENQKAIDDTISKLYEQASALGKSESELMRMQLAARGASDAEIRKAQAIKGVIDRYREQEQVMASLADLDKQVAQLGMSDIERQLDDLRRRGATGEQLAHARRQLQALEDYRRAADRQRDAALMQSRGATDMMSAAQLMNDSAIRFNSALGGFELGDRAAPAVPGVSKASPRRSKTEPVLQETQYMSYIGPRAHSKSYRLELAGPNGSKMGGNLVTTDNFERFMDMWAVQKAREVSN
ncbi:phage tail length tape measure protein [Neisseria shayeganii 871]|uniref:Phage tail length tape measure protein n=2 Tax=Neisseria shayeganii TaxID=607712 RepID=G4CGA2_9NEIS|nr:phage tail length tape measure protein [Neisseria shayeganii 871]